MTIKEAAQMALDVQDACNLSGVVHSFAEVVTALRNSPECTGTDWVNEHPIVTLFLDKLSSLNNYTSTLGYIAAYEKVEKLAKGEQ
jgi:hypothetical protein